MKRTLILDSNTETGLFHSLLFTLAGHKVTEVRSPADALSRILGGCRGQQPFHLLVISHYPHSIPFESFVESLREGGGRVPVLVFRRPENPAEAQIPGVTWCSADDALEAVSIPGAKEKSPSARPLPALTAEDSHPLRPSR